MFALKWDESLLDQPQEAAPAAADADAPADDARASDAPNGRSHQCPHYDQTSVYLTAGKPVRPMSHRELLMVLPALRPEEHV